MIQANSADQTPWSAEGQEDRVAVQSMFAEIAPTYDLCNSIMSLSNHRRWRAWAASQLHLKPGDTALDLCSGTGDFIKPLRKAVGEKGIVLAADFCLPMLERAVDKPATGLVLADAG